MTMSNPIVTIEGNLAADPDFKSFATGNLLKFRVMTNDRTKNADGEWVNKDTSGWNVDAWSAIADASNGVLKKGMGVIVTGKIYQRSYDNKDGNKVTVTEIKADSIAINVNSISKVNLKNTVNNDTKNDNIWLSDSPETSNIPF